MPPTASGAAKPFPKDAITRVRECFGGRDAWFGHNCTGPDEGADRISRGVGFYVGPEGHILTTHAVADERFVSVTVPIQPGSSGAPLLDLTGIVAGVVMAKPEAARLAGLAGEIPEKIELALGAAVIKKFLSG
jgi:hypothetical protein